MDDVPAPLDWDAAMLYSLQSWTSPPASPTNNNPKPNSTAPIGYVAPASLTSATAAPGQLLQRFGQITPPNDNNSPNDSKGDSAYYRSSLSHYQPLDTTLWPLDNVQSLAHANLVPQSQQPSFLDDEANRPAKRRQSPNQVSNYHSVTASIDDNTPPTKRRRGRPKRQPEPTSNDFSSPSLDPAVLSARATHLEKNRVAAHKCRQRQKESEKTLEQTAKEASNKNRFLKAQVTLLKEEVLELKNEVLRHAGCGFWAVDEYLARCAGDWLGRERSGSSAAPGRAMSASSLTLSPLVMRDSGDHSNAVGTSGTPGGRSADASNG